MSVNGNKKKLDQLGMPLGTAQSRLRKALIFDLIGRLGLDFCFQCGKRIENVDDLSIEHKVPWLDSADPVGTFFDLDNISFSHLSCNISAGRNFNSSKPIRHGSLCAYNTRGCRCDECKEARRKYVAEYRNRK